MQETYNVSVHVRKTESRRAFRPYVLRWVDDVLLHLCTLSHVSQLAGVNYSCLGCDLNMMCRVYGAH